MAVLEEQFAAEGLDFGGIPTSQASVNTACMANDCASVQRDVHGHNERCEDLIELPAILSHLLHLCQQYAWEICQLTNTRKLLTWPQTTLTEYVSV